PAEANGNAEGWLYPGSYEVSTGDTAASIISEMVAKMVAHLDSLDVPADQRQTVYYKFIISHLKELRDKYELEFLGIGIDPHN
ncbi:hypothetical protein RFZ55_10320, partial [Acinetobacter baumannii]|nr:hypothetical protein [Acinetobacter baumannii]